MSDRHDNEHEQPQEQPHDHGHDHDHGSSHGHHHDHDDPFHARPDEPLNYDELDPASRSLADALRMSFAALKFLMVLLVVYFLFSGAFEIGEDEIGVRMHLGAVSDEVYDQGLHFAWPEPIDRVVRLSTRPQTLQLGRSFWPENDQQAAQMLDPERDGSLITGDANIVHAQWTIRYRVRPEGAVQFVTNVTADSDRRVQLDAAETLVRTAAERAVVHAVARLRADDFVGVGTGRTAAEATAQDEAAAEAAAEADVEADETLEAEPPVEGEPVLEEGDEADPAEPVMQEVEVATAQRLVQQRLDELGAGIEVEAVLLDNRMPPVAVRPAFERVGAAASQRAQLIDAARRDANETLTQTAGRMHAELERAIEEYEAARLAENPEAAAELELEIAALMEQADGEVSSRLRDAITYRREHVARVRAEADLFSQLLPRYNDSPNIVLSRLWQDTRQQILAGDVETFYLPSGTDHLYLEVNRDPRVQRQRERERFRTSVPGQ